MTTNRLNRRRLFYALLVAGFSSTPQMSWGGDGNDLLRACKQGIRMMEGETLSSDARIGAAYCTGYISGFSEGVFSTAAWNAGKNNPKAATSREIALQEVKKYSIFCNDNKVTNLQRTRVVVRYLEQNPQLLHESESILVTRALSEAFPCK